MLVFLGVACGLLMAGAPAFAADGHIPQETLARIGLAGMNPMSDAQGSTIRHSPVLFWPPEPRIYSIRAFRYRLIFPWPPGSQQILYDDGSPDWPEWSSF